MNPRLLPVLLAGFLAGIPAVHADLPPAPQLLPSDTLAVVTVPDWTRASEQLGASAGGRLWGDPAMRRFREQVEKTLSERLAGDLEPLGIRPADFLALAQGQLTLALIRDGWTGAPGTEPGWLICLDARGESERLRGRIAEVRRKLGEGGQAVADVTVRDRTFHRVGRASAPGADADAGPARTLYFGQVDTALVVSGSLPPLEKLLARLGGGSVAALGDDEGFRAASGAWFRDAYAYGWAQVPPVLDAMTREAAEGAGETLLPVDPSLAVKALGLDGLRQALFALRADAGGTAVDLSLTVPESARAGLFRILAPVPADASPPAFVPAGAVTFQRWRINLRDAWATLEGSIRQASPQLAALAELFLSTAGKDRDPNFDLRRSLVGNLGDDLVSYAMAPNPGATDPLTNPSITLVGSASADALAAAIQTAGGLIPGAAPGAASPDREFNGRTIRSVPMAPTAAGAGVRLEIGVAAGYAALSTEPAILEGFLRSAEGSGRALRDDPAVRAAAQRVGGMGTGLFGYENQRESVRRQWEFLRGGGVGGSPVAGAVPGLDELLRFDLLPPFDDVARHFGIAVYSGQADARGLHLRFFSPDPRP